MAGIQNEGAKNLVEGFSVRDLSSEIRANEAVARWPALQGFAGLQTSNEAPGNDQAVINKTSTESARSFERRASGRAAIVGRPRVNARPLGTNAELKSVFGRLLAVKTA